MKLKFKPIEFKNGKLIIIDQTKLPNKLLYKQIKNYKELGKSIIDLEVRGAPLLGVAAAYGLYIGVKDIDANSYKLFMKKFIQIVDFLKSTRPTAVNLFYAIDRISRLVEKNKDKSITFIKEIIKKEADKIYKEDLELCYRIGKYGAKLIKNGYKLLTHCNAGGLATSGLGTALAPMFFAKSEGKNFEVFVDETRPLLQGARLTTWELMQWKIKTTLICDNMAAFTIKNKGIDLIITGADRIARNGDTANKIGTYNLAILAKHFKIPFYIAAPSTTFDFNIKNGDEIPIEERGKNEIVEGFGRRTAPKDVETYTPAFDVTPAKFIAGFITEEGILKPPFNKSFKKIK